MFVSTRFMTFYWSTFYMVVAGFIDLLIQNITEFNLPEMVTIILGLALAQISKAIRNKISDSK